MSERKYISKELRFKILHRDNFTCQYCGRKAPEVILHVDHIRPVSKGGDNRESNLITACYDCNMGKSDYCIPEMENKEDKKDFDNNLANRKSKYCYYTNYIAKVLGKQKCKKPIDRFVQDRIKTEDDFEKFKQHIKDIGKENADKEIHKIAILLARDERDAKNINKKD